MTSVLALFVAESAANILQRGLDLATTLGLPVTSWRTGDPTRSLYKYLATKLATTDLILAELAKSAFLSTATGDWLKILALEVYGVEVQEATYATGTLVLVNNGGGFYPREAGDLAFKSSITGKTYHSTTGGDLASGPGTTLELGFVADEAGSDSTLAEDELDTMVTTLLGVEIQSSTAAIGLDDQSDESIREQCRDSLGALSPNGPLDAYNFVAKDSELTGITSITRSFSINNEDGTVTCYIAGPTGNVTSPEVAAVQAAFDTWATPNCITATAVTAVAVTITVTATVAYTGSLSDDDLETLAADKLTAAVGRINIGGEKLTSSGGDDKGVAFSTLYNAIRGIDGITGVTFSAPTGDTLLDPDEVPVLGTVTLTVV